MNRRGEIKSQISRRISVNSALLGFLRLPDEVWCRRSKWCLVLSPAQHPLAFLFVPVSDKLHGMLPLNEL